MNSEDPLRFAVGKFLVPSSPTAKWNLSLSMRIPVPVAQWIPSTQHKHKSKQNTQKTRPTKHKDHLSFPLDIPTSLWRRLAPCLRCRKRGIRDIDVKAFDVLRFVVVFSSAPIAGSSGFYPLAYGARGWRGAPKIARPFGDTIWLWGKNRYFKWAALGNANTD